jgi:cell division transport system permease protein
MRWIKEVFLNFKRSGFMSLVSIGTIVLAVLALGGYHIINESLNYIITKVEQKVEVVVFLHDGFDTQKADNMISEARQLPGVDDVKFVSKADAFNDFMKDPDMKDIMKSFDGNPLPDSITVRLKDYTKETLTRTVKFFDAREGVEDIQYGGSEIENLISIIAAVKLIIGIAGIIFAASALLVVSNIIRLTVYARRQDIYIFRMIGASESFIRMPFIMEGVIHGFLGGFIGWALIYAIVNVLISEIRKQTGIDLSGFYLFTPDYFNVKFMLSAVATGTGMGLLGALFSQGRYFK